MASMLRKGVSEHSGTYTYTCGCGFKDANCVYCCGGDLVRCQEAIKTARGQIYYGLLKTVLSHVGKPLVDDFRAIGQQDGLVSAIDVAYLAGKYKLNFKATVEYLEEINRLPTGTYERIKAGGGKARDMMAKAEHAAVCYERGRHEWYMDGPDGMVCRQCGKKAKRK